MCQFRPFYRHQLFYTSYPQILEGRKTTREGDFLWECREISQAGSYCYTLRGLLTYMYGVGEGEGECFLTDEQIHPTQLNVHITGGEWRSGEKKGIKYLHTNEGMPGSQQRRGESIFVRSRNIDQHSIHIQRSHRYHWEILISNRTLKMVLFYGLITTKLAIHEGSRLFSLGGGGSCPPPCVKIWLSI